MKHHCTYIQQKPAFFWKEALLWLRVYHRAFEIDMGPSCLVSTVSATGASDWEVLLILDPLKEKHIYPYEDDLHFQTILQNLKTPKEANILKLVTFFFQWQLLQCEMEIVGPLGGKVLNSGWGRLDSETDVSACFFFPSSKLVFQISAVLRKRSSAMCCEGDSSKWD